MSGLAERARARAALGVTDDDVVVSVVGRLGPQKAHHVLFEAVARCLPQRAVHAPGRDRWREIRPRLRRFAEQLGIGHRTTFLGTRRDVPLLLPGLDVSCLSSVHEGVPIALIEAMAACVPIVASDCGTVRNIVEDGKQGYLVPIRDVDRFADRLRLLAGDATFGLGSARQAGPGGGEFDIEQTAHAYEDLLAGLIVRA